MRLKLMGSFLLLLLLMGLSLYWFLHAALREDIIGTAKEHLHTSARLATIIAAGRTHEDLTGVAALIAAQTGARVTFIGTDGRVRGDSSVRREDLAGVENHLDRPEIQAALRTGKGEAIRYSSTLHYPMLYVAYTLPGGTGSAGFLRLALPIQSVEEMKGTLQKALLLSLAISGGAAVLLSLLLSSVTTRSLRAMAAAAKEIGGGRFERRIRINAGDEVGQLASVLNEMAARVESQFDLLNQEKYRLDTILHGMGEGLVVANRDGVVTMCNPIFRNLFSPDKEVVGKPLLDITRHVALNAAFQKVMETGEELVEEVSLLPGGDRTVRTHWVPLKDGSSLTGTVAVFHDISDLHRLENVRRDFVANVSHELRTPVAVIKGYAETLLEGGALADPELAERFIGTIQIHSDRLARIIADLLSLSELESGALRLEMVPVDLGQTVKRVFQLLEQKAAEKGIVLRGEGLEGTIALADPGRLEQVFVNLVDNGVKYTPEGGSVTVSAVEADGMVRVSVCDTGAGIPPRDIPRLFERFYRVDAARSRASEGTGLGLAIVKHIMQLHGSSVSVESRPGEGACFTLVLKRGGGC